MSDRLVKIEYMSVTLARITTDTAMPGDPAAPAGMPMERLEARICELAGHLTAATCQFLLLIADFDTRKGWADWEMPSCAAWLSWKCQIASGTAREQVRVARALSALPAITAEFAAGRLSYAKVRALTRIATPQTEHDLVEMATPMTANQLERFAQAHRKVAAAGTGRSRPPHALTWSRVYDSDYAFRALLPAESAVVVLQALRAARDDLEHPHEEEQASVCAERRADKLSREDAANGTSFSGDDPPEARMETARDLADALVQVCADYLNARAAAADNPDTYQVIIHAGTQAITGAEPAQGVSAETLEAGRDALPISHPAHPERCHIQDGLAISLTALAFISCDATISTMIHDTAGAILGVGRRTRKPPPALRRAVRERDGYRCQFPGCHSRRTDAHHIVHWANGGETKLGNLISLCKRHHALVHDKGYFIVTTPRGFTFYSPQGTAIPACPPLRAGPGDITTSHDAVITPTTIIPPNSGGRLDLNLAIWIAFANARIKAERRDRYQPATQAAELTVTGRQREISAVPAQCPSLTACTRRPAIRQNRKGSHEASVSATFVINSVKALPARLPRSYGSVARNSSARRANRWAPRSADSARAFSAAARTTAAGSPRAWSTRARKRSRRPSA